MNKRVAQMGKLLNNRASREQLCQRRVATCRQLVDAAETRLAKLRQQQAALRTATPSRGSVTIQWHQQRQRSLTNLDRRIARIQGIRQQLKRRASRRQTDLVNAAQLRRAVQKAATRLQQQAAQAADRSRQRRFDDLVRTQQISRNRSANAPIT